MILEEKGTTENVLRNSIDSNRIRQIRTINWRSSICHWSRLIVLLYILVVTKENQRKRNRKADGFSEK